MTVYVICSDCKLPKRFTYDNLQRARYWNPERPPSAFRTTTSEGEAELMMKGFPPHGFKAWCNGHIDKRSQK